ncbi:hypothetical protein SASPL_153557 [Salvia splendens]|uniref:Uncharacterized protein n=1 Tax=Salvia splendens TaxID=180675 RepID=A0A8X8VYI6_SALSN|nr:hypothetical protein SASPL_153557 [Salvia splendens]
MAPQPRSQIPEKATAVSSKAPLGGEPPPAGLTSPQVHPVTLPPPRPPHAPPLRQRPRPRRLLSRGGARETWQIRSICVLHLLSSKRVQSYRRVRDEETSLMVEEIKRLGASSKPANLTEFVMSLTNDVISRAALGKKSGAGEKNFLKIIAEFGVLLGVVPLWDYIPWLSWMRRFDGVDGRIEIVAKALDQFLEDVIEGHRVRERRECDGDELDFVDILLDFQRENENGTPVDDDTIKAIILDMYAGGTDTTSTALEWAMAELIRNPTIMKTLQNEIREVVGSKGEIEEKDLEKMTYLKGVTSESLRLHSPIPFLVPRELTQDTKVLEYDVASGTRLLVNVWAIARDPLLWEKPEEFYPERFLNTTIDYRGPDFEYSPFGAGWSEGVPWCYIWVGGLGAGFG